MPDPSTTKLVRPTPLRTATMPPSQTASHDDLLAAAELFARGLEIELAKPVEKPESGDDVVDTEDEGSEGVVFSLERALDLVVGVSGSS